ncbi:MAG: NAD(+)/NADH kinase [Polyangiaceae bacterium]|nr:NAD(+)/NADH kinase [Polyangiaceae bacterium]
MSGRAVVVVKRTSFQRSVEDERDPRILALLDAGDASVRRMRTAHDAHRRAVDAVSEGLLRAGLSSDVVGPTDRFDTAGAALVVTVGGDGTLLTASHQVGVGVPVLGVNSAPEHSVGFFCGADGATVDAVLARLAAGELPRVVLTRMEVRRDGALLSKHVLNDALFCHESPAATSRYLLRVHGGEEEQRSSGFWVGPAAGSTAAQRSAGGDVLPLDSDELQLVVREPYTPYGRPLVMTKLLLRRGELLEIRSKMHDARLFLDGPAERADIRFGEVLTFTASDEPLTLLGMRADRTKG